MEHVFLENVMGEKNYTEAFYLMRYVAGRIDNNLSFKKTLQKFGVIFYFGIQK